MSHIVRFVADITIELLVISVVFELCLGWGMWMLAKGEE